MDPDFKKAWDESRTEYQQIGEMISLRKKKNSRPKDKYDGNMIRRFIDKQIDYRLDTEKQDNYDINHQIAINSIVQKIENAMKKTINKQR